MIASSGRSADQLVFALVTLMTFILHEERSLTVASFASPNGGVSSAGGETEANGPSLNLTALSAFKTHCSLDDLNRITRKKGSWDLSSQKAAALADVIKIAIDKFDIRFPEFMNPMLRFVGYSAPFLTDTPVFIDRFGLIASGNDIQTLKPTVARFEGCWRLFRVGTASTNDRIIINRSFLHIKPTSFLETEGNALCEFTIDQRTEAAGGSGLNSFVNRSVSGIVVVSGDEYITLLGQRNVANPNRIGNVGLLTWPYNVAANAQGRPQSFYGLSLIPNSEGQQIASYFLATFIEGSDRFTPSQFAQCHADENELLGSQELKDLLISDTDRERIMQLHESSGEHRVFYKII